ncbi:hypothetical protein [Halostreptopolyspora alba]|uniref:Uncharacterized protein n=1 Tax=Halostreptopolyspora alba TaxID=2487137 RepID=A0A3N0EB99_9ACTN|nr:hypothetical protein EFW17_09980 [Nocardiopsaceae bacterium YIM 96095]
MKQRRLAAAAFVVGASVWLSGCGLVPGDSGGGGSEEAEQDEDAGQEQAEDLTWEDHFPEGVTPVIEMDEPGGEGQDEALDEFFAFYGELFQAIYDQDTEQAFLAERLTDDAPSPESLRTGMNTFIDANAVPTGDMRFYNGQIAPWSQDAMQVDFCVDQRTFALQDADSGEETQVPEDSWEADAFRPNILQASGAFTQDDEGVWRSESFSITPVDEESSDTYECLSEPEE